jgi:hypothetical protein
MKLAEGKTFHKPVIEIAENDSSFNSDNCNYHDTSMEEKRLEE